MVSSSLSFGTPTVVGAAGVKFFGRVMCRTKQSVLPNCDLPGFTHSEVLAYIGLPLIAVHELLARATVAFIGPEAIPFAFPWCSEMQFEQARTMQSLSSVPHAHAELHIHPWSCRNDPASRVC